MKEIRTNKTAFPHNAGKAVVLACSLLIGQDRIKILEPGLLYAPVFSMLFDNSTNYGLTTICGDVLKIAPGFDSEDTALRVLKDIQLTAVPSRRKTAGLDLEHPGLSNNTLVLGGFRCYAFQNLHYFLNMKIRPDGYGMQEPHPLWPSR